MRDHPHPGSVRTRSPVRAEPPAGRRPDAGRHDSPRRWSDPEQPADPTSAPRRVTDEAGRAEPTPGRGRHEAVRSRRAAAGGHGPTPDGRAARRSDRLAGQDEPGRFAAETRAAETGAFRGNGGVEGWSEGGWRPGRAVGRAFGWDGMWIVRAARIGLAVRVGRVGVVTAERASGSVPW